jgi:hypothetical protein
LRSFLTVACSALFVFVIVSCMANKGTVWVINNATEPISRCIVSICGQTIELRDILPTKSAEGFYKVKSDSHYDISIEFQSGRKLRKELGYVTNGLDFHDRIVVTNTDIVLENRSTVRAQGNR